MRESSEKPDPEQGPEKKENIWLSLKIIRHGERDFEGRLTDYGREITREQVREAQRGGVIPEGIMGVKAIGSTAGPAGPGGMQRALETAHIYAEEAVKEGEIKQYKTRKRSNLNYQMLQEKEPFGWTAYYAEQAEKAARERHQKSFGELSDEEKAEAAHVAQNICLNRLFQDKNSEAFIRDVASNFSFLTDRYIRMADRLKSDSKVLYVGGTHGVLIEPFLRETLVRHTADGKTVRGFQDVNEIGGAFRPSEAFTINIGTDAKGEKAIQVIFDSPDRQKAGEAMTLDTEKLKELREEYIKRYHVRYEKE